MLYSRATVNFRGAWRTRWWQLAIAILAALSVVIVITTAWAGRGSLLTLKPASRPVASLNQALVHAAPAVGSDRAHLRYESADRSDHGSLWRSAPTHQKPAKNSLLTRERPPRWERLTPQEVWSLLPASFTAGVLAGLLCGSPGGKVRAGGPHSGASPPVLAGQDILTQLCVVQR